MMILAAAGLLLASTLYEQTVERLLAQRFGAVEYLLVNARTQEVAARNWARVDEPIPVGSLTKPFLAAELPLDHTVECREHCWNPAGHGRIGLRDAIAVSCNQYFLQSHAAGVAWLPEAAASADTATLLGLRGDFRIAPVGLAGRYIRLVRDVEVVRQGMRLAVQRGTASAVNFDALAKTGTARCTHSPKGRGDGLAVVLWPSAEPEWLLLIRVHGTTGSAAAGTAGAIVRLIHDAR